VNPAPNVPGPATPADSLQVRLSGGSAGDSAGADDWEAPTPTGGMDMIGRPDGVGA
jgi:hypothetical protein